jgi:glycosyltransferase involved in cell wall biosynthesis
MILISVVIPVFNNNDQLVQCLKALEKQTLSNSKFEVIVVDNGSEVRLDYISNKINLKIIDCQIPGSYFARNCGISKSIGDYIALTDSDCVPDKNWLKRIFFHLENNKQIDMISGDINYFFRSQKPNLFELYNVVFGFDQKNLYKEGASVTANLIVKKKLFNKIGMFKTNKFSGSDTEWTRKASKSNVNFIFASDVIIYHPARHTFEMLLSREKRIYGGDFKIKGFDKMNYFFQLITSLYPLRPPIRAIKRIITNRRVNLYQKFCILLLLHILRIVSFIEHLKLVHNVKAIR